MTCTRQMAQVSHSTSQLHMATAFHFFSENILSGAPALEPAEPGCEWGAPGSSPSSTSAMAEGRGRGAWRAAARGCSAPPPPPPPPRRQQARPAPPAQPGPAQAGGAGPPAGLVLREGRAAVAGAAIGLTGHGEGQGAAVACRSRPAALRHKEAEENSVQGGDQPSRVAFSSVYCGVGPTVRRDTSGEGAPRKRAMAAQPRPPPVLYFVPQRSAK